MISIPTAEDMGKFGARVARLMRAGDVVCLTGELGAGKTTFTRGLGSELNVVGTVTSPTFVIARTHPRHDGVPFVHIDAYRLHSAAELDDLDIDWENVMAVVEWGSGMLDTVIEGWLEIVIERSQSDDDETRTATVHPVGPRANEMAEALRRNEAP